MTNKPMPTNPDLAALSDAVTQEELEKLKRSTGIPHMPTQFTYELRKAVSGEGPRAYDWSDKPHRLLYDACREIERINHPIGVGDLVLIYREGMREECAVQWFEYRQNISATASNMKACEIGFLAGWDAAIAAILGDATARAEAVEAENARLRRIMQDMLTGTKGARDEARQALGGDHER